MKLFRYKRNRRRHQWLLKTENQINSATFYLHFILADVKIQQLKFSHQELIQTNEVLKALMDEFTVDAENERVYFKAEVR